MRIVAVALCIALGSLVAFTGVAHSDPQGKRVALIITSPAHPFIAAVTKAFT